MIAPALDLAARRDDGIGAGDAGFPGAVVEPGEGGRGLRSRRQELVHLLPVDGEIGEALVGEAARQTVEPADRRVFAQGPRVEVEFLDQTHHHPGADRPLVALHQVEIAGRDGEARGGRGLSQALAAADAAQRRSGEDGWISQIV
jgi:hypothetical protein